MKSLSFLVFFIIFLVGFINELFSNPVQPQVILILEFLTRLLIMVLIDYHGLKMIF